MLTSCQCICASHRNLVGSDFLPLNMRLVVLEHKEKGREMNKKLIEARIDDR